jgi:hypothetical protein
MDAQEKLFIKTALGAYAVNSPKFEIPIGDSLSLSFFGKRKSFIVKYFSPILYNPVDFSPTRMCNIFFEGKSFSIQLESKDMLRKSHAHIEEIAKISKALLIEKKSTFVNFNQ